MSTAAMPSSICSSPLADELAVSRMVWEGCPHLDRVRPSPWTAQGFQLLLVAYDEFLRNKRTGRQVAAAEAALSDVVLELLEGRVAKPFTRARFMARLAWRFRTHLASPHRDARRKSEHASKLTDHREAQADVRSRRDVTDLCRAAILAWVGSEGPTMIKQIVEKKTLLELASELGISIDQVRTRIQKEARGLRPKRATLLSTAEIYLASIGIGPGLIEAAIQRLRAILWLD